MKKVISVILVLSMLFQTSIVVSAQEVQEESVHSVTDQLIQKLYEECVEGTVGEDIIRYINELYGCRIYKVEDLKRVGTGLWGWDLDQDYILVNDLDFMNPESYRLGIVDTAMTEGEGFTPIGSGDGEFTGSFDGGGYTISNLMINLQSGTDVGLFSTVGDASISNLNLFGVNVTGGMNVGAVAGSVQASQMQLTNVKVTGQIAGGNNIGGFVGATDNTDDSDYGVVYSGLLTSVLANPYASTYPEMFVFGNENVGGVTGNANRLSLSNSFSFGYVSGNAAVGGLFGYVYDSEALNAFAAPLPGLPAYGYIQPVVIEQSYLLDADYMPMTESISAVEIADANDFDYGIAYGDMSNFGDLEADAKALIAAEFNSITIENDMKWQRVLKDQNILYPGTGNPEDYYNFAPIDEVIDFAAANGMKMRGHVLFWGLAYPQYNMYFYPSGLNTVVNESADQRATLIQYMDAHAEAMMTRVTPNGNAYMDVIDRWDVVNELGSTRNQANIFYRVLGDEFLDVAFDIADNYDSDCILIWNEAIGDFKETDEMASYILNQLERLSGEGHPVDGFAVQGHALNKVYDLNDLEVFAASVANKGYYFELSELDARIKFFEDDTDPFYAHGAYHRDIIKSAAAGAGDKFLGVTMWSLSDINATSWTDYFYPLDMNNYTAVYNESLQAKPAYFGVRDAFADIFGVAVDDNLRLEALTE